MECPVRAITAGPDQYIINPDVCIECEGYFLEARCKWACPVDACVPERPLYQFRDATLTNRGAPPVVLTATNPTGKVKLPIEIKMEYAREPEK
jgi:hypothetical protein